MKSGVIFDIKKFAIHDGPGIRTTVFFKGCPLSCDWCHNPEGLKAEKQRMYRADRCIGCEECVQACPQDAITLSEAGIVSDQNRCIRCGVCAATCPSQAMEFAGSEMTVDQVMAQITKDVLFYDESGGGVTFSGGEPLMQADFLCALLDACGDLNIHRTVDTTGDTDADVISRVARRTDLFLYDLKHMDSDRHRQYTGVSNRRILDNLKFLCAQSAGIQIRIPVIPGFNDDTENIERTGAFLAEHPNLKKVNLLPLHLNGSTKSMRLGMASPIDTLHIPGPETLHVIAARLEGYGLEVNIGG
ncbi:MAG: glycyl-radical enzyme activating protein [Desulfobacterales bacterium]